MSRPLPYQPVLPGGTDPVAVRAAKEAVAATDPTPSKYPWITRGALILGVFVLILGVMSLFVGAYNSSKLSRQNAVLTQQVKCNSALIVFLRDAIKISSPISAKDRLIVDGVVDSLGKAVANGDTAAAARATNKYNKERAANDAARSSIKLPPLPDDCGPNAQILPKTNIRSVSPPVTVSKPAKHSSGSTPTSVPSGGSTGATSPKASSGNAPASRTPTAQPAQTQPVQTRTVTGPTVTQTPTAIPTPPATTSSPPSFTTSAPRPPLLSPVCKLLLNNLIC